MSGRFKGRSIFCPDKGDITEYTLGDGNACRRSREPPAADLQSCHIAKRLPSRRWAMAARADVPGSRLLPTHKANYMAKRSSPPDPPAAPYPLFPRR